MTFSPLPTNFEQALDEVKASRRTISGLFQEKKIAFQAGASSRDAEVAQWQKIIDEEAKDSALVIIERDQLRTHINVLLKALQLTQDQAIRGRIFPATASPSAWFNAVTIALASTPEQSLAEYRNKVIEECAAKCKDKHVNGNWMYDYREECEAAILDMKEQP